MAFVVKCGELFEGCPGEARGETEAELLEHVARHVQRDHGLERIDDETLSRVKAVIRQE